MLHGVFSAQKRGTTPEPPVGRIFVVGHPSDYSNTEYRIDGYDEEAEWEGVLLPNDRIQIIGGDYGWLTIQNIKAGSNVYIENYDTTQIYCDWGAGIYEEMEDVTLDFRNKQTYGLKIKGNEDSNPCFELDGNYTLKNVTIRGVDTSNVNNMGWRWYGEHIPYDNGSGQIGIQNLTVEHCKWSFDETYGDEVWYLFKLEGTLAADGNVDEGFVDGFNFRHNIIDGGSGNWGEGEMWFRNAIKVHCAGNVVKNMNHSRSEHIRQFNFWSCDGIFENNLSENSYGNLLRVVPIKRSGRPDIIVRNNIKKEPLKYSTVEVNENPVAEQLAPGMVRCDVECIGNMYSRTSGVPDPNFTSTAVDGYNAEDYLYAYNNVAIYPYDSANAVYGGIAGGSNNLVYANHTAAGITDLDTLIPDFDSPMKGAGVANVNNTHDFYGTLRPDPPTVGPIEAADDPEPPEDEGPFMLTLLFSGLADAEVLVNDESLPNNQMIVPANTVIEDITPTADGYAFSPASATVTMDEDKEVAFTATEV